MLTIRPDQHARILGFAILGYGSQVLPEILFEVNRLRILIFDPNRFVNLADLLPNWIAENHRLFLFFLISAAAGLSLLAIRSRSRVPALLFVLCFVSFFPLGTILSLYLLFYLFVIKENEDSLENQ